MAKKLTVFLLTLTLALVAASAGAAWDDGDLPQRQEAMLDAVRVMANYDQLASADPPALKWAMATVNGELALLRPIFKAISKMPETTAAEVRAKEEARAAANVLLTRHLGELLPGGGAKIVHDL